MNHAPAIEQLQKELSSMASGFERITHPKCKELLPFKESIAEFRKRGASFNTIAIILRKKSIDVSHDTVWRFCRTFIEAKPTGRRGKAGKPLSKNRSWTRETSVAETVSTSSSYQERGPRIARVEDL